jgi:hypothetical protein
MLLVGSGACEDLAELGARGMNWCCESVGAFNAQIISQSGKVYIHLCSMLIFVLFYTVGEFTLNFEPISHL